jgi:FkbM family methyltransferase
MINWILTPVHNGLHLTQKAVATFLKQDIGNVRVLLIDNESADGTNEWARSMYPQVVSLRKSPQLSVAQSWNKGLSLLFEGTPHEHVLVVNNDVELRPDTYRMLLSDGGGFVTAVGDGSIGSVRGWTPLKLVGCEDKVKIGKFMEMGIPLKGVVHVGTNEGYEVEWYLKLGLQVIGFEAYSRAAEICQLRYPDTVIYNGALGEVHIPTMLQVASGDGCGSTFLGSLTGEKFVDTEPCDMDRMDAYDLGDCDCLVVDVQGMELEVLKGAGDKLKQFKCLNIECSRVPQYEGEAPAAEVVAWLDEQGFYAITPIEDHNDILFVRKDVLGVRPHPDFSCYLIHREVWEKVGRFDEEFKGAFCEDWDYHVRLHKAGVDAHCISVPFYHVGSATINAMSPADAEKLSKQAGSNREYFKQKWGVEGGTPEYYSLFCSR